MKAILYPTHGEPEVIELASGLRPLQELVGGDIESVVIPAPDSDRAVPRHDATGWINDDGKYARLPRNEKATALVASLLYPGDYIAGPMVITGMTEDGENVDVPDDMEPE